MLSYLYNIESEKKWKFGLERTEMLLEKIGNPHKHVKAFHVTGTNGKGSVCAMISAIIGRRHKVGMFTSPHLVSFNERFVIGGEEASDEQILAVFSKIKPHITDQTFFEIVTCMAFLLFREKKVEYAVIEVGLGGRLDATNVITPLVSVITMVDYEHTNILGESLEEITLEKCGIIKQGIPVVTGSKKEIVLKIIERVASSRGSELVVSRERYKTNLLGDYQELNAGISVTAIRKAGLSFSEHEIEDSLMNVSLKGRLDYHGNLLFDVAHNPSGINSLVEYLKSHEKKRIICIFGVLSDKDWKKMVDKLCEVADYFVLTTPQSDRALDPSVVANYISGKKDCVVEKTPQMAFEFAMGMAKREELVLVTGSFYVVGDFYQKVFK